MRDVRATGAVGPAGRGERVPPTHPVVRTPAAAQSVRSLEDTGTLSDIRSTRATEDSPVEVTRPVDWTAALTAPQAPTPAPPVRPALEDDVDVDDTPTVRRRSVLRAQGTSATPGTGTPTGWGAPGAASAPMAAPSSPAPPAAQAAPAGPAQAPTQAAPPSASQQPGYQPAEPERFQAHGSRQAADEEFSPATPAWAPVNRYGPGASVPTPSSEPAPSATGVFTRAPEFAAQEAPPSSGKSERAAKPSGLRSLAGFIVLAIIGVGIGVGAYYLFFR